MTDTSIERNTEPDLDAVESIIQPVLAEYDIPGMAVGITIDGRSNFFNYGVASRESNARVTEETIFEIGSVAKLFTATLVGYAEALGELSLDHRPGRYIPELKGTEIDEADLLALGTYVAGGLPLQFPPEVVDEDAMIRYFREWRPDFAPGERRMYSNPSIGLLGRIAGIALGGEFASAMETRLLPELGLQDSFIQVPQGAMARYAWGYNTANEPVRVGPGMFDAEAYGIKSTAADMIRFIEVSIDSSDLDSVMRRAIETTQGRYFEIGEMVQGLGWERYSYPATLDRLLEGNSRTMIMESNAAVPIPSPQSPAGPALFNKTGSTNGFSAYVAFIPESRIGVVILANKNFPIPARIEMAHAILEQLAPASSSRATAYNHQTAGVGR